MKQIRSLLEEYNACLLPADESFESLTLSEALDSSSVGARLQRLGSWGTIACGKRREIIDTYFSLCRSNEEIAMLEEDARNIILYYEKKKQVITTELQCLTASDAFTRGATALLSNLLHETSQLLTKSIKTALDISSLSHQQSLLTEDYSDTESSSSDDSSDLDIDDCIEV